jgi:hypothetical protein
MFLDCKWAFKELVSLLLPGFKLAPRKETDGSISPVKRDPYL